MTTPAFHLPPDAATLAAAPCPLCGHHGATCAATVPDYSVSRETFYILACTGCGLHYTWPAPAQAAIGPYYQSDDYISHTNSRKGLFARVYQVARGIALGRKQRLVQRLSGKITGQLLDYGCGTGEFLHQMKQAGWQVQGMEPADIAATQARQNYGLTVQDPSKVIELQDNSLDVITLWHVLEHVHQLHPTLHQLTRALRPGGLLLLALPNHTSADARHYGPLWAAWDVPRHLYHFAPQQLTWLAKHYGLVLAEQQPMPMDAYYVSLLSEGYAGKRGLGKWLNASLMGRRSNASAGKDAGRCSSVIYALKKPA